MRTPWRRPVHRAEWVNTATPEFHLRPSVAKSLSSLMSFCSPSYSSANHCYFACVSFHIPVLPFPPALPSISGISRFVPHFPYKILLSMPASGPSSSVLSHIPLPFPPMYFLSLLHFLFPYFPSFSYFPCLSRISPLKILLSKSVLPFLSIHPSLPHLPVLWNLPLLCLFYVFLSFFLLGFSEICI